MIAALVQKDLRLFFRNQFFTLMTALGLAIYIGVYVLLPAEVDETLPFALYIEGQTLPTAAGMASGDGLAMSTFDSQEALVEAVESGEYMAGVALPANIVSAVLRGAPATVQVYYAPGTPSEVRDSINSLLASRLNRFTDAPGANMTVEVLGRVTDSPIPLRDQMLPTLLLVILVVEIMGLGTLIVEEIEHGTARALLTTPVSMPQFFTSKAVMGIGLAFVQVFVLIVITGKIAASPLIVTVSLLVGCLFITGVGFLVASISRDMMSVIGWGMLLMVILSLPSLTIMLPMIGAGWMEYIPSFYLVDTLHQAINFGAGWADVAPNLVILLVIGAAALFAGSALLRKRFA